MWQEMKSVSRKDQLCIVVRHDDFKAGDDHIELHAVSILYSPNYFKNCILRLRLPALRSLSTRGYTNPKKISLVAKKSCTSHNTEGVFGFGIRP